MTLMLGKLPPDPTRPALMLAPHLLASPPQGQSVVLSPVKADWLTSVRNWPMYGNDLYGDCVWAMIGHAIRAWTTYAGTPVRVPLDALLKGYSDVTGFNPDDPSTDQGTVMQDALDYWRKVGVAGHKILAFAKVDHTRIDEIRAATNIFGAVLVGIRLPASAMDQFRARRPWALVHPDGGIEGGHAVHVGQYDSSGYGSTSWARLQRMTLGFAGQYIDEVWAAITPEWLTTTGRSPSGLDLAGLGRQFSTLTGQAHPFG